MKTLKELNTWWYRLIKVAYGCLFFFFVICVPVAIYYNYEPRFDGENTYVVCNSGQILTMKEIGLNPYSEYIPNDSSIREACYSEITDKKTVSNLNATQNGVFKDFKITTIEKNYTLISVYTARNWIAVIGFSLLSLLTTVLVFELARRIFYYIVLGSFRPSKS